MKAALFFSAVICSFALGILLGIWIPMTGEPKKIGDKNQQPGVLTALSESPSHKDQKTANLAAGARAALRLEGKPQKKQLAALTQEFRDLEMALIGELDKANSVEQKSAVVFLMGWYRSIVCLRVLAENVTLEYESTELEDKKPLWGRYPAVEALTKIGKAANWHMFRNIETGKDTEFRRLSCEVILRIEGPKVARFILELELKKTKDETGRQRFQEALDYLGKAKD